MKSRSLKQSFHFALKGIKNVFVMERNMKLHAMAAFLAIITGCYFGISRIEWGLLIITIFVVIIAEAINTAIERVVDMITSNYHPLAELAKNAAAGAVLISAVNAVVMAIIIFSPYILK